MLFVLFIECKGKNDHHLQQQLNEIDSEKKCDIKNLFQHVLCRKFFPLCLIFATTSSSEGAKDLFRPSRRLLFHPED